MKSLLLEFGWQLRLRWHGWKYAGRVPYGDKWVMVSLQDRGGTDAAL
jgi:hypothetical protein